MSGSEPAYKKDQVVNVINSVIQKMQSQGAGQADQIFRELTQLKTMIEELRADISSAQPGEIKNTHIPSATDELELVVQATEEATGSIMDSCEVIQQQMDQMEASAATIVEGEVTKIYEACTFQDLTGQRIQKVVKTLAEIESRISNLLSLSGAVPASSESKPVQSEEESLLNGPQSKDKAISQDEIDRLLSEF